MHNVLGDPPFSKLDLLSCRNLLIYLENVAQQRLLRLFHHALNPAGLLFLGPSESVEEGRELYTALDRKWKLFRRADVPAPPLETLPWGGMRSAARDVVPSGSSGQGRRKGGAVLARDRPIAERPSYFFFAFLAFLAAFFAFFAIVPPEGVLLVPDGDSGCARG